MGTLGQGSRVAADGPARHTWMSGRRRCPWLHRARTMDALHLGLFLDSVLPLADFFFGGHKTCGVTVPPSRDCSESAKPWPLGCQGGCQGNCQGDCQGDCLTIVCFCRIFDLQYCVSFRCTLKWFRCVCVYLYLYLYSYLIILFFGWFSLTGYSPLPPHLTDFNFVLFPCDEP